jgi:hypothetical protein
VKKSLSLILVAMLVTLSGCALTVGKQTVGIQSGRFFYSDGVLRTNYHAPFESVWTACRQAMKDMGAVNIEESRKISKGKITGILQEDNVEIGIDYAEYDVITVGVRVGITGNNAMSRLFHDRIKENLLKG